MDSILERFQEFFKLENFRHLWIKSYEWFELTLITLFGRIPYEPIKNLFINPWFWFIIIFIIILAIFFRKR